MTLHFRQCQYVSQLVKNVHPKNSPILNLSHNQVSENCSSSSSLRRRRRRRRRLSSKTLQVDLEIDLL